MLTIGITGGIGSGKSLVCKVFEWLGIPVYYADIRAKWLITHHTALKEKIIALLGQDAYSSNGAYQTAWVAQQVFENPDLLKKLNDLVHPVVKEDTRTWIREQQKIAVPYVCKEAALLFESGAWEELDYIIYVHAPEELRLARVLQRDNMTEEAFFQRVRSQWPEDLKAKRSKFVLNNDGKTSLLKQIIALHEKLIFMSKNPLTQEVRN